MKKIMIIGIAKRLLLPALVVLMITISTFERGWAADVGNPAIVRMLQALDQKIASIQGQITALQDQLSAGVKSNPKRYYLTKDSFTGDKPLGGATVPPACAEGFHMANFFEIVDPSNLQYDTTLGFSLGDTGTGPPSGIGGWVRTGAENQAYPVKVIGRDNCNGWTYGGADLYGSAVSLQANWYFVELFEGHVAPPEQLTDALIKFVPVANWWQPGWAYCNTSLQVWCVENP